VLRLRRTGRRVSGCSRDGNPDHLRSYASHERRPHAQRRVTQVAIKLHSSYRISGVSIESHSFPSSPWTSPTIWKQPCILMAVTHRTSKLGITTSSTTPYAMAEYHADAPMLPHRWEDAIKRHNSYWSKDISTETHDFSSSLWIRLSFSKNYAF
jgi:hypothetical protein